VTSYARILSHPAQALDPNVTDTRLDTDSYHRYATDHPAITGPTTDPGATGDVTLR
jgi:hypothetical protein